MITRIAVPDLVTNSYFPALAGEELGFFRGEGVDGRVELVSPAPQAVLALRNGEVDFVVTGAHTALTAFPGFRGAKLAVAVAQGTPWLLVLRADLPAVLGDVRAARGLRIGAAPGPDAALVRLLAEAGVDPERDGVQITRVPGTERPGTSFGVLAAEALRRGELDGFWANALGSETSVRNGVGRIVVDVRRGDGPAAARDFTFAALVTTEALIARDPGRVAATVRGIVAAQRALRGDPELAAAVGRRRFPADAAAMIVDLIERDRPFYEPTITERSVAAMGAFARAVGLLDEPLAYDHVVATGFRNLWGSENLV
jgi:NitT/TauT family transport system substrate-binding protein